MISFRLWHLPYRLSHLAELNFAIECSYRVTTSSTPADFNQRQPVGVSRSTVSCGLISEASRLRYPGACSRRSVARRPPIPVSESQAIRLPYRVAVYVELTRPTYRAHHAGDSWLLVIRLPPRLLRCGCYMMFHLFVVSGSGQPAGFATGIALRGDTPIGSALKLAVVCAPTSRILIAPHRATRAMQSQL